MIKTKDPFKKLELEDKVKSYKANLTKLTRINKVRLFSRKQKESFKTIGMESKKLRKKNLKR